MRVVHTQQMSFGQIDISMIELDPKSRDDIPAILVGLQHIYTNPELHDSVFEILQQLIPQKMTESVDGIEVNKNVSSTLGRPGMEQWKILVFGILRLGSLDWD